ncbi:DeoR/GlpR family DNA-binding transcription regulator [Alkalihalobacillus sp. BA299]|uniref:DeoR/GlpR family DNA-binding transcription regulator n=1 Tax=Alkalihalobacillus sp. BA299 TaxID=2815938 RepID=UPI001AD98325|nr:DeoR/GlpR family DNA-binding transcription regulator [Alkalihalobacillus sp. BA299]
MEWFPDERKRYILDQLRSKQKVQVTSLSEYFSVTTETIRRDLDQLEKEGMVKRVYGGAVLSSFHQGEPSLLNRKSIMEKEKKLIGKKAAELIKNGSTIVIDVGTTVIELANEIKNKENITILTNSLPVSTILIDALNRSVFSGKVILLGGELNPEQHSVTGKLTEMLLENFIIDQAFISVGGVSLQNGLSDYDLNESMISKAIIKSSKEMIVLADHSKLGVDAFCKICSIEEIDAIVCNTEMPNAWLGNHLFKNVDWILAD